MATSSIRTVAELKATKVVREGSWQFTRYEVAPNMLCPPFQNVQAIDELIHVIPKAPSPCEKKGLAHFELSLVFTEGL